MDVFAKLTPDRVTAIATVCTAVVTAVYTIATIFICRWNKKSAEAAAEQSASMKAQTDELLRQYRENVRARISVRYGYDDAVGKYVIIKNVGKTDADDVRIVADEEFVKGMDDGSKFNPIRVLSESVLHVAAGQEFPVFVGFASKIDRLVKKHVEFSISYRAAKEVFKDSATIDFSQYRFLSTVTNSKTVDGKRVEEKVQVKG